MTSRRRGSWWSYHTGKARCEACEQQVDEYMKQTLGWAQFVWCLDCAYAKRWLARHLSQGSRERARAKVA